MQRAPSPISIPNTFRDSNDATITTTTTARDELVLPSAPSNQQMEFNPRTRQSIIRPAEPVYSLSPRNNSANQHRITNQPSMKSIVRSNDSDDERSARAQVHHENLIHDNNTVLEASGYDPSRLTNVDADAAFALQLQQEEYSRESLALNRHNFLAFPIEQDDETVPSAPPLLYNPANPQFTNDEQLAAYLQQEENRTRQMYHQAPEPFFPRRPRSNPTSNQTSESDEHSAESGPPPFSRFVQRPPAQDDDDSDEYNPYVAMRHPIFQLFANRGRPLPEDFPAFFPGFRGRGHRRSGNLQDTQDDFGPEDYERLLQLDDTISKKKLTQEQINTIPLESFQRTSNNSDEENKCGICLEQFEPNQTLRRFPCRHIYHKECGDRWLQENNVCPICRETPIKVQSMPNSRHYRSSNHPRRPPHTNRNPINRNNTNTFHSRKGPSSQRPS